MSSPFASPPQWISGEATHRRWSQPGMLAVVIITITVLIWWGVEVLDTFVLDNAWQRNGIGPGQLSGLDGVLWAPFLHSDFGHVVSNTFPFVILSALVLIRGFHRWTVITLLGWFVGGFLTWLFADGNNHIGASGVVFTYFGALLGAAAFERRPASLAPALVTLMLYTTMLAGLVPQARISWEGHLAGFVVGISASRLLALPRRERNLIAEEKEVDAIFGGEQPWLEVEPPD